MKKPSSHSTLTIQIDAALAEEYKSLYFRMHGSSSESGQTIEEFIVGFVEDRLAEEISFLEEEAFSDR